MLDNYIVFDHGSINFNLEMFITMFSYNYNVFNSCEWTYGEGDMKLV